MIKTLLSKGEVKIHQPKLYSISTCSIQDISLVESDFFECWGEDFYNALLSDLMDHSGVDSFDGSISYNNGDKAIYNGYVFVANKTTTQIPSIDSTDWELADKFNTPEYNDLWCRGLARALSMSVICQDIPSMGLHIGDHGVSKYTPDGADPVSMKEKQALIDSYESKVSSYKSKLVTWMKANNDNGVFDTHKDIVTEEEASNNIYNDCGCKTNDCDCSEGGIWIA